MLETDQICPYTGLRSFTEEESLYFKGRDEDIDQATEQLQRNKFLMLTGASGDGKSSLIYAGIIPNARSGFLKSKYSQWCVADFRPERTPFQNLCTAIARQLDIPNVSTVQTELQHGFSAVIDLYKNSKRYLDTTSVDWQMADDAGKAAMKRTAANLIILVDQFEEFFTNPENYQKGIPSVEATLVLNLLLETARIALEEDLPVYVVFTMRSDFIGQCAAFRGLPEYIGFSQFFVPRLNRTQLQYVIEEPAVLSGNRITRRLTERLIHDITEGVDQLPILQHALNQIWHAAGNGTEEMDLLHYAMVGGMPLEELPDEQVERFQLWFAGLAPEIKACYNEPNLQNVLDTHTNKLYEQAGEYYFQKTGKMIAGEDVKAIIKNAFICLTKIDQGRAVRNRMTLQEITDILGRPEFGTEVVGSVLNIFREPGNTFIRPFIQEGEDTALQPNQVLDITHESLIRNWKYLERWAKEEFELYTISLDFEQQLNRWVGSGKTGGFLLSIGQLTYFENWFTKAKPNAFWIARYLPEDIAHENKMARAEQALTNAREFLKRSAAKHVVTRTIMQYGARRIAAVLGIIALIALGAFSLRNYLHKQNSYVLQSLKEQTIALANKPKLSPEFPIPPITEQLILGNLTIPEVVDGITDLRQKIVIATGIATQLVSQGRDEPRKEIFQSLGIADSLLEQLPLSANSRELSDGLKLFYDFAATAQLAYAVNPDSMLLAMVKHQAKRSALWALHIYTTQPPGFTDIQMLSLALDLGINQKIFSIADISRLLEIMSPFENLERTEWINNNYQKDIVLVRGRNDYGPIFNGLFQDLAYLYAAAGKPGKVLQCMDTLLAYQKGFLEQDYASHIENASHIATVFYTYENTHLLDEFVHGYCNKKNIPPSEFYNRLVSWSRLSHFNSNFYTGGFGQVFSNQVIDFASDALLSFFFDKMREEMAKTGNSDERHFNLAVSFKNQGVLLSYRRYLSSETMTGTDTLFKAAVDHYRLVSPSYLNQVAIFVGSSASDEIVLPRRFLFLYPDYRVPFHPFEPRIVLQFFYCPAFIGYVLDQHLFDELYDKQDDLKYFEPWLLDYQIQVSSRNLFFENQMPGDLMRQLADQLQARNASQLADLNILYLHLGEYAIDQQDSANAIAYLRRIQTEKLLNAFQYKNLNFVNTYSLELTGKAIAFLAMHDHFDDAYRLLNVFKKEVNRSSLYAYASQLVSLSQQNGAAARRLLDSARVEMLRLDNPALVQPNRHQVAMALMYLDPGNNEEEAYRIIKNSFNKFQSMSRFSRAYAYDGNLYQAQQQIPLLVSAPDLSLFLAKIAEGYSLRKPLKKEWRNFKNNEYIFYRRFLPYVNENE